MDSTDFMPDAARLASIRQEIERHERERLSGRRQLLWRVPVFVAVPIMAVAVLAVGLNVLASPFEQWRSTPHVLLYVAGVVGAIVGWFRATAPVRTLGDNSRQALLPLVFGFIDAMTYSRGIEPSSFERLPREAMGETDEKRFGDVIAGAFGGFSFELYEADLTSKEADLAKAGFKGVVVAFEAAMPFAGVLVATVKSNRPVSFLGSLFGGRELDRLESGAPDLDALYDFRTDNAEAAGPLVRGRLASALNWLSESWPGAPARIALSGPDGFLLLPSTRDFFELPSSSVPLDFDQHVRPIIAEMATILAIAALVRNVGAADPADPS